MLNIYLKSMFERSPFREVLFGPRHLVTRSTTELTFRGQTKIRVQIRKCIVSYNAIEPLYEHMFIIKT